MTSTTPEPATAVTQVRTLIADLDTGDSQIFTDAQLQAFLDLEDGNVRRGAADALDAIAVSELLVSKVIRSQDLSTDGAKVAAELRARARDLRAQADAADDTADWFGFDVAHPDTRRPPELSAHEVWGL